MRQKYLETDLFVGVFIYFLTYLPHSCLILAIKRYILCFNFQDLFVDKKYFKNNICLSVPPSLQFLVTLLLDFKNYKVKYIG